MSRIVLLLILYLFSTEVMAQVGQIKGVVLSDSLPIEGAVISVPLLNKSTLSKNNGQFQLLNVPPGKYQLQLALTGYESTTTEVEVVADKTIQVTLLTKERKLDLDELVVTGTRYAIPIQQSPVIINTISNKTFEATQSLSLAEGLNFAPGLRLENNCQNCGFTQLRMNGLDGPYSQILINSRPIFSALAGVYGLEMLPTNMISKVEVMRGGGSVLYGGNAIAGTVNIITKDPSRNSIEASINQALIDMEASDRTITFNSSIVNEELNSGLTIFAFNRNRDYWDANNDGFSEITKLQNSTIGLNAFRNFSGRSRISLSAMFTDEFRRGGNKFSLEPHQTDITEQLKHRIGNINLTYEHYSKNYKQKVAVYSSIQWIGRQSYYGGGGRVLVPGDSLTDADLLAINAYGKSNDFSLVSGVQYAYEPNKKWHYTIGSELQMNSVVDQMPGYGRSINQQVITSGSYVQVLYKPIKRLTITSGARFDGVNISGNYKLSGEALNNNRTLYVLVPRVSALYNITSTIQARVGFAQGYRAPQAFNEDIHIETVGGAARFVQLGAGLKTERSNSYTASINYTKTKGKNEFSFLIEGFRTELNNPFINSNAFELPSGVAVVTKRNGSGAIVQGLNIEGNMAYGKLFVFQIGTTIQEAKYRDTELLWEGDVAGESIQTKTNTLLRTPNIYGYYTAMYNLTKRVSVSLSGNITGNMMVAHVIDPENEKTVLKETPWFFDQSFRLSYDLYKIKTTRIQIFGGAQNVFNSFQNNFDRGALRDAGFVFGPARPRTLYFGMKFTF